MNDRVETGQTTGQTHPETDGMFSSRRGRPVGGHCNLGPMMVACRVVYEEGTLHGGNAGKYPPAEPGDTY